MDEECEEHLRFFKTVSTRITHLRILTLHTCVLVQVDFSKLSLFLVPVHLRMHWCLVAVQLRNRVHVCTCTSHCMIKSLTFELTLIFQRSNNKHTRCEYTQGERVWEGSDA